MTIRDELDKLGKQIASSRRTVDQKLDEARELTLKAVDEKVPEAEIARRLGVDRMSVRTWQGKR